MSTNNKLAKFFVKLTGNVEKLKKWYKLVVLLFLIATLIGLYFVQTAQFQTSQPILDILYNYNLKKENFPRALNWLALVLLAIGWILWELAISRMGNRIIGYIGAGLIFSSVFFAANLISFVFGLSAVFLIVIYLFMWIPKKAKLNAIDGFDQLSKENKLNMKKWKKALSFKTKKSS